MRAGDGLATQRIGAGTRLRVVDAIVSGTHEPGTSHYELLRAFACDTVLQMASAALEQRGYRTHEFGDSVLIERGLARQPELQASSATGVSPARVPARGPGRPRFRCIESACANSSATQSTNTRILALMWRFGG